MSLTNSWLLSLLDICVLPPDPGPCDARIQRWYFDEQQNTCVDFIFGGCQGNSNNFASKKKCRMICKNRLHDLMASIPTTTVAALPTVTTSTSAARVVNGTMNQIYE